MAPKRWLECPWFSTDLIADIFIASKTFLDDSHNGSVPEIFRYHPNDILMLEEHFKNRIGMVIDLNNSTNFYDSNIIKSMGKTYHKLPCEGFNSAPSKQQVREFIEICRKHENNFPNDLILVHCTHGYNRTGFMIVSYLFEERMMDIETSIKYFNDNRSPGIYKQEYVNELINYYGNDSLKTSLQNNEIPIKAPPKPHWILDDINRIYSNHRPLTLNLQKNISHNIPPTKLTQQTTLTQETKFGTNSSIKFCIPSLNIFPANDDQANRVKHRLHEIFPNFRNEFPGSQPVSMDSTNVDLIKNNPYAISWKADGTRYLMYIATENMVFMIDRDFNIFLVPSLVFAQPPTNETEIINHVFDTLVDGEMVVEHVNRMNYPRFMIYDIIQLNGNYCGDKDFWKRYHYIRVELIDPRDYYIKKEIYPRSSQTFGVRRKQFYQLSHSTFLIRQLMPSITHKTDGIIFQPVIDNYCPGTCRNILKWKPHHLNTVDFQLRLTSFKEPGCLIEKKAFLYLTGSDRPFGEIKYHDSLIPLNNKIVECNITNNNWNIIRVREDKSFANSISTAKSVMESITNPVTEKELFKILNVE